MTFYDAKYKDMLKVFESQLGLAPQIIVLIVVGALFLGVGTIYLYQQFKNQPPPLLLQAQI